MKKIKCDLSLKGSRSIYKAIDSVELYKNQFIAKVNVFIRRLGLVGIATVESISQGQNFDTSFVVDSVGNGFLVGTLLVSGEEILFFEFGTGVHYNREPSPHPHGARLGMIIGEYGLKQGKNDYWIYDGKPCYGQPAQMPVYKAYIEMILEFERIAKEVFIV